MANTKSKKARIITNEKARLRNQSTKAALRTYLKNATTAIEAGEETSKDMIKLAQSKIGSAQSKGRVHKNTAARRTSRLMKKANAAASAK